MLALPDLRPGSFLTKLTGLVSSFWPRLCKNLSLENRTPFNQGAHLSLVLSKVKAALKVRSCKRRLNESITSTAPPCLPHRESFAAATHDLARGVTRERDNAPAIVGLAEDVGHATDRHDAAVHARACVGAAHNRGTCGKDADALGRIDGSVPVPREQSCD